MKLVERARSEAGSGSADSTITSLKSELREIERQLKTTERNLALAQNESDFAAVSKVRAKLSTAKQQLESEIVALEATTKPNRGIQAEVSRAIGLLDRLPELAADPNDLATVSDLFRTVNARVYARFEGIRKGKRTINKLVAGVITFGDTTPPITLYHGKTDRRSLLAVQESGDGVVPTPKKARKPGKSGRESKSVGNANRGSRI